jgi:hypothetical protein
MALLRQVYLRGYTFRALNGPGIFYSTHAAPTHASAASAMHAWTGMHEPAYMHTATADAAWMNRYMHDAAAATACMHACVAAHACVIDTVYQLIFLLVAVAQHCAYKLTIWSVLQELVPGPRGVRYSYLMVKSSPAENLGQLADERFSHTFQNASMPSCISKDSGSRLAQKLFVIERLNS